MYKALYLSPMIPSFSVGETVSFFKELLLIETVLESEGYAVLQKDDKTVHILNAGEDIGQMEFYLEVDNIDAIWKSLKDKLTDVKHKPPFDREYGMREIHIAVPFTNTLLFLGQSIV